MAPTELEFKALPVLLFVSVCAATCDAKPNFHKGMPESEPFDRISTDYVTPHIKWATPYINGKLKVLVLAPLMRHRETVELYQRLDMEFAALITSGPSEFIGEYFFMTEDETLELNMSKLTPDKQYDVIVIAVSWRILPRTMKLEIARRVNAGMGALFTDYGGHAAFIASAAKRLETEKFRKVKVTPGIALGEEETPEDVDAELDFAESDESESAPPSFAGKFIRLSMSTEAMMVNIRMSETTFGKGRVVSIFGLNSRFIGSSDPPLSPKVRMGGKRRARIVYDFHMAHLAKAVIYTAQKEPDIYIQRMHVKDASQSPIGLPAGLTVKIFAKAAMPDATVDMTILDELRHERFRYEQQRPLRTGEQELVLDVPFLPEGGRQFIVIRLLHRDKVVSWDALSVEPRAGNSVERFEFHPSYLRGERIEGKVILRTPLTDGQKLTLELLDNLGRVLFKKSATDGKIVEFIVPPFDALVPLHRVRARIRQKEKTIYDYDQEFLVEMGPPDNYNYVLWTDTQEFYYRQILMDRYYDLGVTAGMGLISQPASNLRPWCYITNIAQWREGIVERAERIQNDIGEEVMAETSEFKTKGLGAAKEKVDAALELEGVKIPDTSEKPIGPIGNPCFNDPEWVRSETEELQSTVRKLRPYSPVGYSLGDENQIAITCHSEHCIRAYRQWLKEQFKELAALNRRYDTDFKSWDEAMWPKFEETHDSHGKLAAWYDRQRFTDWTFNNAHLICKSAIESVAPGARVGYSSFFGPQPERGVDALRNFPWATFNNQYQDSRWEDLMRAYSPRDSHRAVIQGTYSGYKHRLEFVCYPWIEFFRGANGKMWWRGQYFKDATSCLDPGYSPLPPFDNTIKMANEVRRGLLHLFQEYEFQNAGIRVLYSMPDMYAAYVKDQKQGPANWLSATQGMIKNLRHRGWQFDYINSDQIEGGELGDARILFLPGTECVSEQMEKSIRSFVDAGGTLVADIVPGTRAMSLRPYPKPLLADMFEGLAAGENRQHGKGHVFLSGSLLQRRRKMDESTKTLITSIIRSSSVNRNWELLNVDGSPATGWELFTYKNGTATVMAIGARDELFDSKPAGYTLRLSQPAVMYDVRRHEKLDTGTSFNVTLSPDTPRVFASLPNEMGTLQMEAAEETYNAGDEVRLSITLNPPPGCVTTCLFEVSAPDKLKLRHYDKPLVVRNGKAEYIWHSALSDKGKHTLRLTETISAQQVEVVVNLE